MTVAEAFARLLAQLRERKVNYQLAFGSPAGQQVLRDLARFCRAEESEWDNDGRHHARYSGRREVWLRIREHLNLTPEELAAVYRAAVIGEPGEQ